MAVLLVFIGGCIWLFNRDDGPSASSVDKTTERPTENKAPPKTTAKIPAVDTNAVSEGTLLAAIPQLLVKRESLVAKGWGSDRTPNGKPRDYLASKEYPFAGVQGEAQFLYHNGGLVDFAFWVDSDVDFAALYKFLCKTLQNNGVRSGKEIRWVVGGEHTVYEIILMRPFENDRGVDILLWPK